MYCWFLVAVLLVFGRCITFISELTMISLLYVALKLIFSLFLALIDIELAALYVV